jgi:hypothetical protein
MVVAGGARSGYSPAVKPSGRHGADITGSRPRRALALTLALLALTGCPPPDTSAVAAAEACVACHAGIELASPTHPGCVSCHGGDPLSVVASAAHRDLRGGANPSDPAVWEAGCGTCHPDKPGRVTANLMFTNTGMIKNIALTWEGPTDRLYAAEPLTGAFDADGVPRDLPGVAELDHLSGELYRKFCSECHLGRPTTGVYAASHASGCAACHFPFAKDTVYAGADPTVHGRAGRAATHAMSALPPNAACERCHNRSGRIALTYQGLNDGNSGLVPTRGGWPGPTLIGGARNATAIAPDVHHAAGLECIDCHTAAETMGDGYAYDNLYQQTEVRCEDCHGGPTARPATAVIAREHEAPLRESRAYARPRRPGDTAVLTSKGRPFANVVAEGDRVILEGKRDGRRHPSKLITGDPVHTIHGHERLACYSCHSRTVAQCFGCHTEYDRRASSRDFIRDRVTPGAFSETEDYRALFPFPLAVSDRDTITPVTPGCQTLVTVIDADGTKAKDEAVATFKGRRQFRFAPFFGHNVGTRAIGCTTCHANPAFVGFGQHVVDAAGLHPTLLAPCGAERPLDGFLAQVAGGELRATAAITRDGGRPLSTEEIRRFLAVNLCLVCHERPDDPIYQAPLDFGRLDACLRRAGVEPARPAP